MHVDKKFVLLCLVAAFSSFISTYIICNTLSAIAIAARAASSPGPWLSGNANPNQIDQFSTRKNAIDSRQDTRSACYNIFAFSCTFFIIKSYPRWNVALFSLKSSSFFRFGCADIHATANTYFLDNFPSAPRRHPSSGASAIAAVLHYTIRRERATNKQPSVFDSSHLRRRPTNALKAARPDQRRWRRELVHAINLAYFLICDFCFISFSVVRSTSQQTTQSAIWTIRRRGELDDLPPVPREPLHYCINRVRDDTISTVATIM